MMNSNENASTSTGGQHALADLSGSVAEKLRDADGLMACLEDSLIQSGFHVLDTSVHKFTGGGEGFTGMVLLSESHAAIHTYPEAGYLAMDVFSCGRQDSGLVIETVARFVEAQDINVRCVRRAPATDTSATEIV